MAFEMNEEDKLYDEFGNYIGPSLGETQGNQEESEVSESEADSDWNNLISPAQPKEKGTPQVQDMDVDTASPILQQQQQQSTMRGKDRTNIEEMKKTHSDESMTQRQLLSLSTDTGTSRGGGGGGENWGTVVLHEDKEYYETAQERYPGVETIVHEEDTQPLEQPIIAPIKHKCFQLIETVLPTTTFSYKFLAGLMDMPSLIRNVALVGHLHHGKTSFMDLLVKETHTRDWRMDKEIRYTDIRRDEQSRGLSIKCAPMSLVLGDLRDKHFLINIMDTPGHVNFSDELSAALRLCDGIVLVVDCAEGVLMNTKRCIEHAAMAKMPVVLVLNKMDRLIIELKLPPRDCYLKLVHTIAEVNNILSANQMSTVSPVSGNVVFSSALFQWSFTLPSFSQMYANRMRRNTKSTFDANAFCQKLWGDNYMHSDQRLRNKPETDKSKRTFVQFVLEPLYKIYAHVLGNDSNQLAPLLSELGIKLKKRELKLDPKPLLTVILSRFFAHSRGFTQAVVDQIPSPMQGNAQKVTSNYTGDLNTELGKGMLHCDPKAPLMINVTKMFPRPDASAFDAFGRVFSGTVHIGDKVRVLREGYTLDDREDMSELVVDRIWVYQGRYRVEVNRVTAGNWALFGGIGHGISKTATITHCDEKSAGASIFLPLKFNTISVVKVAIEPIKPSELPKMTHGLRCVNQSYPLCTTKVEESGEHVIIGTGELYMDCVLHDLREMFSEIEVKVADPVVSFCETVEEMSSMQCFALTPNKKNRLTMVCEPLDKSICRAIESNHVSIDMPPKQIAQYFETKFGWDELAGRHIWAFGPDKNGPNILQDDTLPGEVDKNALNSIRRGVVQGFQWGTREGPLCDEPMRGCRFKLVQCAMADNVIDRVGGQIIPTTRRVLYSSFMLASPKLMEPIFFVEMMCPPDCVKAVEDVVNHRRGRLLKEMPKPGTPFAVLNAEIPAIDSFGFETDLRSHTHGQAFGLQVFSRWEYVPGDPMDETIQLTPLEPQPTQALAREFMVKTRKRKGLTELVTYHKFFDEEMYHAFAQFYDET